MPFVVDGLSSPVILAPASSCRLVTSKPFLQLVWVHGHKLIELPEVESRKIVHLLQTSS